MLICILTKNVITSCSVTMMLFLHLEVKPLMTLTTVIRGRSEERFSRNAETDLICRVPLSSLFPYTTLFRSPLPPETELSRQMTTSTTSIDIMGLQAAYANLHTDQERDYFMQRYHDVISSFGGKTSYDADNRHKRFYLQIKK